MKQYIDSIVSTDEEVRQAVAALEAPNNQSKKRELIDPRSAQAESDFHVIRIIQKAFSELSTRGKGVCIEGLVRDFTKEKE